MILITTKILLIFSSINLFQINTQILLYTRRNRKIPDVISYSNISGTLPLTKFNISAPLKVIIHGFGSSCQRVWPSEMRLALLTVVGALKRISCMRMTIFLQKKTLLNILKLQIFSNFNFPVCFSIQVTSETAFSQIYFRHLITQRKWSSTLCNSSC